MQPDPRSQEPLINSANYHLPSHVMMTCHTVFTHWPQQLTSIYSVVVIVCEVTSFKGQITQLMTVIGSTSICRCYNWSVNSKF